MYNKIKLSNKTLYGYGVGNLGYGMILQALTTYFLFFGTSILKIPGSLLGIIISISVFWDAISDPIMGSISDFTKSKKFGRRHFYILIGCFGMAFFNSLLWSLNENWSINIKAILIILIIFGVKTLSTVYVTPYLALSGELTDEYNERTKIQSIRTIFFVLGMAFTVVVGMTYFLRSTDVYPVGQLNRLGYMYLGFATSILMIASGLVTYFSTKKFIPELNERINNSMQGVKLKVIPQLKADFEELKTNRNYLLIAVAYLSTNLASAVIGSIGLHVFTYTFRLESTTIGIILGAMFLTVIISQPFWLNYSYKKDKRNAAILATFVGLAASGLFLISIIIKDFVVANPYSLIPFFMVAGFSIGGLLTFPLSMVGDTIDIEELNTGRRSEGLYYGGLTFSYKFSQAIAIFFIGILLDYTGFNPEINIQAPSTEIALGIIMVVGCFIAFGLTLVAYYKYNLSHEDIQQVRNKLKEK